MEKLLKALNDQTRRDILAMLQKGDLTAGEIANAFDMRKPSISHHLNLLKEADLVSSTREGQFIRYRLNTTVLDDLLSWLMNLRDKTFDEQPSKRDTPFSS